MSLHTSMSPSLVSLLRATAFLAVVALFAAQPQAAQAFAPDIETFTLENGMEVVVVPDRRAPVVTHMVWYRVGSADEPLGQSGVAHFFEHLMFKGTEDNPGDAFSRFISSVGGQENAFTSSDYTAYFQRVARNYLGDMMRFEADRMTNLTLTEEVVETERGVIIEERNSRTDNNPSAQLGEALSATLWFEHPYGRPVIGWMHEIEAITLNNLLDFYKRFYTPNNAILIVAGDVSAEEVRTLAEEHYGKIEPRAEVSRERVIEPVHRTHRRAELRSALASQPSLRRTYVVPSFNTGADGEGEAIDLLADILGGGSTSHLYKRLVKERQIAVSAGAYYRGSALDDTELMVFATPAPGTSLAELEAAVDEEIAVLLDEGFEESQLDRIKSRMLASAIYARDSQSSMARIFGIALTTGGTVEEVLGWPDQLKAVTADQILEAGKTYLQLERAATGYLIPEPAQNAGTQPSGNRS
ncbi:MAG: pitrilysin family protein [Pseudomonadota bacterium]